MAQCASVSDSVTHSALILSHFSPLGPISANASAVRSTCAASPSRLQHLGHGLHGVGRFEQQAAGLGRGRQQPFALQQVLGVEDALGRGGEVYGVDAHGRGLYSRKALISLPQLGWGARLPTPAQGLVDGNQAGGGLGTAAGQAGPRTGAGSARHPAPAGSRWRRFHNVRAPAPRPYCWPGPPPRRATRRSRARAWVTSESSVSSSAWSTVFSYRSSAPSLRHLAAPMRACTWPKSKMRPGNAGGEHVGVRAAVAQAPEEPAT